MNACIAGKQISLQGGIKQLFTENDWASIRQFVLCFPVAYSSLFTVFQSMRTNNNSIIVWSLFTRLVAAAEAQGFYVPLTCLKGTDSIAVTTSICF